MGICGVNQPLAARRFSLSNCLLSLEKVSLLFDHPVAHGLSHNHCEVHSRMNDAIQVKYTRCLKWPNALTGIPYDLGISFRCSRFSVGFRLVGTSIAAVFPHSVLNDMGNSAIIDQRDHFPF